MSFFISDAFAEAAPAAQGGDPLMSMVFFGGMIVIFYFLLIRPQQKRTKEHKKLVEGISKGDEIITNGGFLGKVVEVGEQYVGVEVSEGMTITMQKSAVATVLPKGSIKAAHKET